MANKAPKKPANKNIKKVELDRGVIDIPMSMKEIEQEFKRQMEEETKGMSKEDKAKYLRDFFVKNTKGGKTSKTMTAAKGGVAKKRMRGGGMVKAAKKMMRGGMAKKKMARGGAAAKKKMARGGVAKKK